MNLVSACHSQIHLLKATIKNAAKMKTAGWFNILAVNNNQYHLPVEAKKGQKFS